MNFLLFGSVADVVGDVFNIIWFTLNGLIYGLIVVIFRLFTNLSQLDILSADQTNGIYQRVTMVITIVMVFYITFEFVKYVVQPDTISDKEKGVGKIGMRIVIAILLIAFIPTIFNLGMRLQNKILSTNVISKVILGQDSFDFKDAGSNFAGDVFSAFYRVDYSKCGSLEECQKAQNKVDEVINLFKEDSGLLALVEGTWYSLLDVDDTIQYDGLLAVVFGAFILYVVFLYCIDLGVRYIQLIFLQIIAPIAAISYIVPQKDGMFQKWTKQVTTTYLDVFIRVAILYFMLLIVSILSNSLDFFEMSKNGTQINIFEYLFVIAGLLIFVQRAPKLLEELLPFKGGAASIGYGFSGKSRFEPIGKTVGTMLKPVAGTAGLVAGGFGGLFTRETDASGKKHLRLNKKLLKEPTSDENGNGKNKNRFLNKMYRGATYAASAAKAGFKGASAGIKTMLISAAQLAAQQSTQEDEKIVADGGTVLGKMFRGTHYQNELASQNLSIKETEDNIKKKEAKASVEKTVKTGQDSAEDRAKKKLATKEQKVKMDSSFNALADEQKALGITIEEDDTTSTVHSKFEAVANSKKAAADAINQELAKLEKEKALVSDPVKKATFDKDIAEMKVLAQQKAKEAVDAATALTKAEKELSRFAITKTLEVLSTDNPADLNNFITNGGDAVLASNLKTALNAIKNVQNADTDGALMKKLEEAFGKDNKDMFEDFKQGKIKSFAALDKIQSVLTEDASRLGDEVSTLKENVRRTKESEEYNRNTANAAEGKK